MLHKKVIFFPLIVSLLGIYAVAKYEVDRRVKDRQQNVDIRYLPTPRMAEILSFGFREALADLYWIEAVNYYGTELTRKNKDYKYLESYCDIILQLDPLFGIFYDWAATAFVYNGLPITKEWVDKSTYYANRGVQNFFKVHRYSVPTILKGGFNYAVELGAYAESVPYFAMAGRTSPDARDMLLVASNYAGSSDQLERASDFKMEYLGFIAFEAQTREQIRYAMQVLGSSRFNRSAADFVRNLRIQMEDDEDMKKVVESRLKQNPILRDMVMGSSTLFTNRKLQNVLAIDTDRTWLPPELHLLLTL